MIGPQLAHQVVAISAQARVRPGNRGCISRGNMEPGMVFFTSQIQCAELNTAPYRGTALPELLEAMAVAEPSPAGWSQSPRGIKRCRWT